jgi:predicted DNA-binding transcriptional regulator YafY
VRVAARPASFARPAGFDALVYLRESVATMARQHAVEVLLHTDLKTASGHFFDAVGVFEQTADGVLLRCHTDHLDWFASHLGGLPFDFVVRAPDTLRAALAAVARRLLRLAGEGESSAANCALTQAGY